MRKKVVCWGMGAQFVVAASQIKELYDIQYVVDRKETEDVQGYKVYAPMRIRENMDNIDFVFVTTYKYCFDVYLECIRLGVQSDKIKYWDIDVKRLVEIEDVAALTEEAVEESAEVVLHYQVKETGEELVLTLTAEELSLYYPNGVQEGTLQRLLLTEEEELRLLGVEPVE